VLTLKTPITEIHGIGPTNARRLKHLGINTILDLIYYFPYRHDDFSHVVVVSEIQPNEINTIKAKIQLINNRRSFRRRMFITEGLVADNTGSVKVVWFNQPYLTKILKPGDQIILSGKVDSDHLTPQFISPIYEKVKKEQLHVGRIVPVYSTTENLTQKQIRFFIKSVLFLIKEIKDFLPEVVKKENNLMDLPIALKQVHFPDNQLILQKAIHRLKFDELFLIQLGALQSKKYLQKAKSPAIKFKELTTKKFVKSLPFELTDDQRKASWEIIKDLEKGKPMNRLLEGDVGSGKTVVAKIAMLNTVKNGFQTAFMAPTEILALQHFNNLVLFLKDFNLKIGILTHSQIKTNFSEKISKGRMLKMAESGEIQIMVGTHALIQENVRFKKLSLVIIDEQHRFGVEQRKTLREKSSKQHQLIPHLLSMTATPIPRSLALTIYGDLDLSILLHQPKDRLKIITKIVSPENREKAYQFIKNQIREGRQVFVICPLIEPSDKLGVKSVKQEYEKLDKNIFPDLKIGLLHGKLKPREKEKIMEDLKNNKINILVSTSVVEVGIDIPNATVMMIEGAERFGLAQMHQFRGRVGRSKYQSYCFLFTESESQKTDQRLNALVKSENGFELAEYDLKLRGPGELYGLRQSGLPDLKMASLTDVALIKQTRAAAQNLIDQDPELKNYPLLLQKIAEFQNSIHWE